MVQAWEFPIEDLTSVWLFINNYTQYRICSMPPRKKNLLQESRRGLYIPPLSEASLLKLL